MNLERTIIKNLVRNEAFYKRALPYLKKDYFTDVVEKQLFTIVDDYILKYNKPPKFSEVYIELKNNGNLNEEQFKKGSDIIKEIHSDKEDNNYEWLIDSTEKFCQQKAIYLAMLSSMSILDGKDKKHQPAQIPELLSNALAITFDPNIGHDYLEDMDRQYEYYHSIYVKTPFNIDILNTITNGGIPEKTLSVLMAGVHVGKTLSMCSLASDFLTIGKNVLYITLEMAEEQIIKRIDANLLNTTLDELELLPRVDYIRKKEQVAKNTNGKLIVKEYPTSAASVLHFRALLNELKLKKGFKPDIIFIDYINICASARYAVGGAGMYEYIKGIAEELRGLAIEFNTRIITATQVNRDGFKSSDPDMTNIAESFGLPATADFMLALTVNDQLIQMNQIMFTQLKNRFGDVTRNTRFIIGVDRLKMRLYDISQPTANLAPVGSDPRPIERKDNDRFASIKV